MRGAECNRISRSMPPRCLRAIRHRIKSAASGFICLFTIFGIIGRSDSFEHFVSAFTYRTHVSTAKSVSCLHSSTVALPCATLSGQLNARSDIRKHKLAHESGVSYHLHVSRGETQLHVCPRQKTRPTTHNLGLTFHGFSVIPLLPLHWFLIVVMRLLAEAFEMMRGDSIRSIELFLTLCLSCDIPSTKQKG